LSRFFVVGPIIYDRAHAGPSQRVNIRPVKPPRNAKTRGQRNKLGCHTASPELSR
jgi:hypothetical protein